MEGFVFGSLFLGAGTISVLGFLVYFLFGFTIESTNVESGSISTSDLSIAWSEPGCNVYGRSPSTNGALFLSTMFVIATINSVTKMEMVKNNNIPKVTGTLKDWLKNIIVK